MTISEIVSIVGMIISVLTLCGIGYATKEFWISRAERKKQETQEYKKAQNEERKVIVREVIKEELKPIKEDIATLHDDLKELQESDQLQKESMQSILRDRLYELYNICSRKGFASLDERENFENMYQKYHSLGVNGVMDDIHKKFLHLPTEEYNENQKNKNNRSVS